MVWLLLAAPVVVATAQAGAQASVELAGDAPFSRVELDDALGLRLDGAHRVAVAVGRDAIAVVTVDGRSRTVYLGDRHGADAARLVALVAAGLSLDAPAPIDAPTAIAPTAQAQRRPTLAVSGVVSAADGALTHGVRAEVASAGTLSWIVAVGAERRDVGPAAPDAVTLFRVPVRVDLAARHGVAEVSGGAVLAVTVARGGSGDQAIIPGLAVTGGVALPVGPAWAVTVRVGVDAMATRRVYRWDGATVADTGRIVPWLALGLRWETGR